MPAMFEGASLQVVLAVPDVVASVEFCRKVFGFQFQGYWDPGARRAVQEWTNAAPPEYAEVRAGENRIGLRSGTGGLEGVTLALTVSDSSGLYEKIRLSGANPTALEQQAWGAKLFSVADPNGLRWSFMEGTKR
jgi:uncharacterized glyoxalase superfamily protein PhnB